jgi:predicted type IV restriction endonuclease
MSGLRETLAEVRRRIERYRGARKLNEENTKATLVEPVLRALGWNVEDLEEVQREYKTKRRDRPVDYALLLLRTPRLFIEAKALGEDLSDRRWVNQIMGYAAVAGVEWIALTDGDEYRLYNAHAAVNVDEKLFRTFRISENSPVVEETLQLIARERMEDNQLEVLWKAHFVDRQVRKAIDEMFESKADESLVRLLRRRIGSLSPAEIRASLGRAQVRVEFPVEAKTKKMRSRQRRVPAGAKRKHASKAPRQIDVSLTDLIRSGLIRAPLDIERKYKGRNLKARIQVDGRVTWERKAYDSLSTAAGLARASVIGMRPDGKPPHTNGWTFWKCRQPDGTLAAIDVLRQTHLKRSSMRRVE